MRYIKTLGLLAVMAVAALAFAGAASATILTSPEGTTYTGEIRGESLGEISLHGSNGVTIICTAKGRGNIEAHGASSTASGKLTELVFNNCSSGDVVHVKKDGALELHAVGGGNGTVTANSTEVEVTAKSTFGTITCIYTTSSTDIGLFTGNSKGPATFDASGTVPRTGGSALCGSSGTLTGTYEIETPSTLIVD